MAKLKGGIVGCGGIANGKHLPAIKAVGAVELVAFCDIIEERAVKAAKEYGVEGAVHPEGTFGRLRYPFGGDRPSQTPRLALSPGRVTAAG